MDAKERRKAIIDQYVKSHKPDGLGKLARRTKISSSGLSKIRAGREIQDPLKRESLARVLGVEESELFPPVAAAGKSRAS